MKTLVNADLNQESMAELRELMESRENTQTMLEEHGGEARGSTDGNRGIQFVAFLEHISDAVPVLNAAQVSTNKFQMRFEIIDLPENVSPTYGVVEMDNVHTDKELSGIPIFTVHGRPFDSTTDARGTPVLKVKMRARVDPITGEDWPKLYAIKKRPVTRVVYVYPGEAIRGNIFTKDAPKDADGRPIQVGSIVVVRGVQAREFRGDDGIIHASWTIGGVVGSPVNLEDVHVKKFQHQDILVPRNSYGFMRIDEAPNDRDVAWADRRQYTPELSEFLGQRVQFCSWETNLSDKQRVAHELSKKCNIFWNDPVFRRDPEDYGGKAEKDGEADRYYSTIMFMQTSTVRDTTDPDAPSKETVLHDVRLGERQVRQFLGISDPRKFARVGPAHVSKLRFVVTARPDHKKTFDSDMNQQATRPEEFKNIAYKIVWRSTSTGFAHTNLRQHIVCNGYPVTRDFVKETVGKGGNSLKSSFHEANFYNNLPGSNLFNLSEFTGNLEDFSEDLWEFRLIDDREPEDDKLERVAAIADAKERAIACSASLLGKPGVADTVRLGKTKDHEPVVFAIRKNLAAEIAADPTSHDFSRYMRDIENAHAAYDPTPGVLDAKERKRKRQEEEYGGGNGGNGISASSSAATGDDDGSGSGSGRGKRAKLSGGKGGGGGGGGDDESEESMT